MSEFVSASEIAKLGTARSVKAQFGCTIREAERSLVLALRRMAQGQGAATIEAPARVAVREPDPPPTPASAEQQAFSARVNRYLKPAEPSVDERQYQQWEARQAEVVKQNIKHGYGAQYQADRPANAED